MYPLGGTQQMLGYGGAARGVETLTLFKAQFSDFTILFKTECEIFRPYLRHLTQNQ